MTQSQIWGTIKYQENVTFIVNFLVYVKFSSFNVTYRVQKKKIRVQKKKN